MNRQNAEKHSVVPIVVMLSFILLLLAALVFRVYRADRDLGEVRIAERQARLAAESGSHYAVEKMRSILNHTDRTANTRILTTNFFANSLDIDVWKSYGLKTDCSFRIVGIRKLGDDDMAETPLIDESLRFQVISEGRCGRHRYTNAVVVQLYDLSATFAVFESLDEFYYGRPIQPWVEKAESLEAFVEQNSELFEAGVLDRMGICYDPALLYKMFVPDGQDPFKSSDGSKMVGNFGSRWFKYADSPCRGPLYCQTPIVVDSHKFFGPVQTALYFYRRGNSQPGIELGNTAVALNSSYRLHDAANRAEGRNPPDVIIDRDSALYSSFIPEWRPDFAFLREFAKKNGIYVDELGRGFKAGAPTSVDYHPGENHLYSDSYLTANSVSNEQDEIKDQHIVLSTDTRFNGFNNLSSENLGGARIIFSERSVYLRGEIGSDLVIVTPRHIFLTGPTNVDSNLNLFLVAGNGTALSTVDLEKYINENNPEPEFVDAAREWLINALIYKPGAGVYTTQSRSHKTGPVNFRSVFSGKSLKVRIYGGCIGGNLLRWIDNLEPDSLSITWNREAASRLPVKPVSVNILRMRTRPEP
jgi:hypothetical protein